MALRKKHKKKKQTMTKLQTKNGEYLALNPKELEPLIKADLKKLHQVEREGKREADRVQREAQQTLTSMLQPIRISIGKKLNVAKPHFTFAEFVIWIGRFRISQHSAQEWMRMAQHDRATEFKSVRDFRKATFPNYPKGGAYAWTEPVQRSVKSINFDALAQHQRERESEEKLERRIARELIKIGYNVLATKMHPDKSTGSHDAMRRLNAVRTRLMKVYE